MEPGVVIPLEELAQRIPDGCKLAMPKDVSGPSLAAVRELLRRGVRDLHLVCVPVGGLAADLLIGAGAIATLETSAVTLGELGTAPRFTAAVREGSLRLLDATCPAIYAGLQAAEKGLPFLPLRGLLGSDVLKHRSDWKVIDNPFAEADPIVALPAIIPDVALFHVPLADRHGNAWIGMRRELMLMAHAARHTLVTAERIAEDNLLADARLAPGVLTSTYVSAIAAAPRGAAPLRFQDCYDQDEAWLARYAREARTETGFADFVDAWLQRQTQAA